MVQESVVNELENQLQSKEFKLNSLLEVTRAINYNKPVSEILDIYNFILREQLGIRKFVLYNHQEKWQIITKVGVKGKIKDINIERDILKFKDITVIESSYKKSLNNFDVIIPVFHKEEPLAYLFVNGILDDAPDNKQAFENLNFTGYFLPVSKISCSFSNVSLPSSFE